MYGLSTWAGAQFEVPMGGTVGGMIGVTDGGAIEQICGAQIGGRSILLSQSGCTSPFTQRQTQRACAEVTTRRRLNTLNTERVVAFKMELSMGAILRLIHPA